MNQLARAVLALAAIALGAAGSALAQASPASAGPDGAEGQVRVRLVPDAETVLSSDGVMTIQAIAGDLGHHFREGEALIRRLEGQIADTVARRPGLAGKSAMFVTHLDTTNLSLVSFYTTHDTRVQFFHDLGLTSPSSVVEASADGLYAGQISAERIDAFEDVDIVVTYGGRALFDAVKADPLLSHMPAVARDALVLLGNDPVGTAASPTPRSTTCW